MRKVQYILAMVGVVVGVMSGGFSNMVSAVQVGGAEGALIGGADERVAEGGAGEEVVRGGEVTSGVSERRDGWWTVEEIMMKWGEELAARDEKCHGVRACEEEVFNARAADPIFRMVHTFIGRWAWITAVNPGRGTVKFLYIEENGFYTEWGKVKIEKLRLGWHEPELWREFMTFIEHPDLVIVYDGSVEKNGEGWILGGEEFEVVASEGMELGEVLDGQIRFMMKTDKREMGQIGDYRSCLSHPDYKNGMECRLYFSGKGHVEYRPTGEGFEVGGEEVGNGESGENSGNGSGSGSGDLGSGSGSGDLNSGGNEDGSSDDGDESGQDGGDGSGGGSVDGGDDINEGGGDGGENGVGVVVGNGNGNGGSNNRGLNGGAVERLNIEEGGGAEGGSTSEGELVERAHTEVTKTAGAGENNEKIDVPLAGECVKKTEFPWWLVVILVAGDILVMWWFWPDKKKGGELKIVSKEK